MKKIIIQKPLTTDGYHLDVVVDEEMLAGMEILNEESGSSSGEDNGNDADIGNLDDRNFYREAGYEDGVDGDDADGGDEDDEKEFSSEASSSEDFCFSQDEKI